MYKWGTGTSSWARCRSDGRFAALFFLQQFPNPPPPAPKASRFVVKVNCSQHFQTTTNFGKPNYTGCVEKNTMSLHCSGGLVCSKQSWMACEGQGSSQLYCVLIAFESRGGGAATQQPAVLHSMGLVPSPLPLSSWLHLFAAFAACSELAV